MTGIGLRGYTEEADSFWNQRYLSISNDREGTYGLLSGSVLEQPRRLDLVHGVNR